LLSNSFKLDGSGINLGSAKDIAIGTASEMAFGYTLGKIDGGILGRTTSFRQSAYNDMRIALRGNSFVYGMNKTLAGNKLFLSKYVSPQIRIGAGLTGQTLKNTTANGF